MVRGARSAPRLHSPTRVELHSPCGTRVVTVEVLGHDRLDRRLRGSGVETLAVRDRRPGPLRRRCGAVHVRGKAAADPDLVREGLAHRAVEIDRCGPRAEDDTGYSCRAALWILNALIAKADGHLKRRKRGRRFDADPSEERRDRAGAVLFERCLEDPEVARRPERDVIHVELAGQSVAAAAVAPDIESRVACGQRVGASGADIRPRNKLSAGPGRDRHRPKVEVVALDDPAAEVIGAGCAWKEQTLDLRVSSRVELFRPLSDVVARLAEEIEEV